MMEISDSLRSAREAIQDRNTPLARQLLQQIIEADPANEMAWYLYAHVAENRQTAIYCLEKTLEINTFNEPARQELAQLQNGSLDPGSEPTADPPSAPSPAKANRSLEVKPSNKRAEIARPGPGGFDQRFIIWGGAALLGLLFFCGSVGLFVLVQQYQSRQLPSPVVPMPGYSSTIATPMLLPQMAGTPTQDGSCSCPEATAYMDRTAQRYQVLDEDITAILQALQNKSMTQLDFALLSGQARTLYHDQIAETPPPCLKAFQSKTVLMLWNWQQSMQYLAEGQLNSAQVFIQGFTEQVTALEGEGRKMREVLQSCPGNKIGQYPTF